MPNPGLPSPSTVVKEMTLTPSRPAVPTVSPGAPRPTYRILRTTQVDEYDQALSPDAVLAARPPPVSDNFQGTDRKAAKLSIAEAPIEEFDDIKAVVDSLVSEDAMADLDISRDSDSDRIEQERRNVRVTAFLYAASGPYSLKYY